MKHGLFLIKYYLRKIFFKTKKVEGKANLKLNLGCGQMYLPGWVNIDLDQNVKPDLLCGFNDLHHHFEKHSVDEILMLHSISYLRLWEARDFFKRTNEILKVGGTLTLEFPDLVKCAKVVTSANDLDQYLEGVRGIFAFDLDQIKKKESFGTYSFGWSSWHIKKELLEMGFKEVQILDPETHGKRNWRDTRIIAKK